MYDWEREEVLLCSSQWAVEGRREGGKESLCSLPARLP
jgi:hypothetical protein